MSLIIRPVVILLSCYLCKQLYGVQCHFRPSPHVILSSFDIPKVWGVRCARQLLWDGSSNSLLKWLHLYYFSHSITNNHKLNGLKQPPFISSELCGSEVQAQHGGTLSSGSHEAEVKVSASCSLICSSGSLPKSCGCGRIQVLEAVTPKFPFPCWW